MGIFSFIFSRFRKKKTTLDQLNDIEQKINNIEKFQKETEQQFRRVIGKLVLSSILVYIAALVVYYYYFSPDTFRENILKFMPLLVFPIAIYLTRRLLSWYYKRKLSKNETALKTLKSNKKKILDEVMEKEYFNVAKEILEKYAPEQLNKNLIKSANTDIKAIMPSTPPLGEMMPRLRSVGNLKLNGATPLPDVAFQAVPNASNIPQPKLSLPRPIFPRNRGAFDKLIDMVIGDGPGNRYALLCRMCSSHNGMALKHEFEYLAFRCAYCLQWNPARKQRPQAPGFMPDSGSQDESDAHEIDSNQSDVKTAETDCDSSAITQTEDGETKNLLYDSQSKEPSLLENEIEPVPDLISRFDLTDMKNAVEDILDSKTPSENVENEENEPTEEQSQR